MVKHGEKTTINLSNGFHLAGIVPIDIQKSNFNMPWHDCYMPINNDYMAVERAIYECAMVGCETIWIVYRKGISPILRHRVGDYVFDPVYNRNALRNVTGDPRHSFKKISVFYVPLNSEDYNFRGGIPWSIIYGYKTIYNITTSISRWVAPSKYYVSFPYGVYSLSQLKQFRKSLSSPQSFFLKSPDNKTAKDGEYTGFTFDVTEYNIYRNSYITQEKQNWDGMSKNSLASTEFVDLCQFLSNANTDNTLELEWYYNISSWSGYSSFMGNGKHSVRSPKFIRSSGEFSPLAEDEF